MGVVTANTGSNNWNTNGAWVLGAQPTAADDVTIVAGANVTIPTAVTALARSVTVAATGTLTFATTTSTLTIGDGTAGAGSVAFSNAGTITLTGIGTINFISTSATVQTVTSGGQVMPNLTFNAASNGSWQLSDNLTATGTTLTLTKGTLDTNGKTVNCGIFSSSNANTRVLTLGASAVTCTSGGSSWNIAQQTNMTVTGGSSTITLSGVGVSFLNGQTAGTGATTTYGTVVISGSGAAVFTVAASTTIANLTRTGTAIKTDSLSFGAAFSLSGALIFSGNSTTNRLLVQSNTTGTARTITLGASGTCKTAGTQNVDFMDITLAGGAANERDLSAITGLSGDAGGNSGITLTNAAAQTHTTSTGGSWSDVTKWTSRVPLPQDNVIVDSNTSGTLTVDMPRLGADLTFTGFAGTLAMSTTTNRSYGAATLASGMTITSNQQWRLLGRGTHSFTSASIASIPNSLLSFEGWGATYTIADTLNHTGATGVFVAAGAGVTAITFNTGGQTITTPIFTFQGGVTNLSSSTINISGTSGTTWVGSATANATLNAGSSNIVISTASTSTRTFNGNGQTYATVTYTIANSPGALAITGANTFTTLNIGSGRSLTPTAATTTTVTNFNVNGVNNGYLYLPGVASNYVSTPDSVPLSITSDITILCRILPDNWVPGSGRALLSKYTNTAATTSYLLFLNTDGKLYLYHSDGSTIVNVASSVAPTVSNGTALWVLASWRQSDGRVQFYTASGSIVSPVASDFAQLGTDRTQRAGVAMADTATAVEIGSYGGGASTVGPETFYRAQIYNGVFSTAAFGGTLQFDANFVGKTVGANTFTESSSNAATVTINGALAQVGDGRVTLNSITVATHTLSSAAQQSCDYLSIDHSIVNASPKWYAGTHSTDNGTNTNWIFTAPPGGKNFALLGVG